MNDSQVRLGERVLRLLLTSKGIPKHKHVSAMEELTQLSRNAAHRKLTGLAPFDINEFAEICERLGSNIFDAMAAAEAESMTPATLCLGNAKLPCLVRLGGLAGNDGAVHQLVAAQKQLNWYVELASDACSPGARQVMKLTLTRMNAEAATEAQTVAVLDDDADVCDSLCDALTLEGFKPTAFYSLAPFEAAVASTKFDAFILDWTLSGQSAEGALRSVREHHRNEPIALLTGRAADLGSEVGHLASCLSRYNAVYFTKPTPIQVISETLRRKSES